MVQMKGSWKELKEEIQRVRQGADKENLFNMSPDYFELADQTVYAAELYTEKKCLYGGTLVSRTYGSIFGSCFLSHMAKLCSEQAAESASKGRG